ncbi:transient receptor potential cation channel subfamily M member 2 [Lingula anatina]|uniref:Transient receptor potential cation channel subfamily M member 2 n=1 Tax=Lingula anatina TaxID=7574 RepID=A0A1S3IMM8_LINAN|nr:transient receptor potential cation channel subfamily M member 2 [Lingula anatina]|eukprot:XP_013398789.1 transient receptor potential cation channel subfamily M member 2 [Lingula anatina]
MKRNGKVSPMEEELVPNDTVELQHVIQAESVQETGAVQMPPCETEEDLELSDWIPKHIKRRECCSFMEKPSKKGADDETPDEKKVCYCGREKQAHTPEARESSIPDKWTVHSHTKHLPTNAFGEVEFKMFNDRSGKYVRVAGDTNMEIMTELLMDKWNLELPNLLISVTGGAKNFTMKPRLKEVFRRGLVKAGQSTGAWIITGGMNAGVMKHVGEAVLDYTVAAGSRQKLVTIGIATWGCVASKEQLTDLAAGDKKSEGLWPAMYKPQKNNKRAASLDPNHTHFILVDQGTELIFGEEIDFRAALENEIAKQKNAVDTTIPIVLVVVEGGPGTIHTVHSAIMNGTPAVIVDGSGRAADIFAFAYKFSREVVIPVVDQTGAKKSKTITVIDEFTDKKITEMVKEEFGETNLIQNVTYIKESLIHRDLVTVFTIDQRETAKDIDVAILHALLKANRNETLTQLRLALAWNRIDVAESEIFTDDYKLDQGGFNQVMQTAVLAGKVQFISLFLDNGINLHDFLTMERLEDLYDSIPENSYLNTLIDLFRDPKRKGMCVNLYDIAMVIQELMGDSYSPLYTRDPRYYGEDDEESQLPMRRHSMTEGHMSTAASSSDLDQNHEYFDVPARELFVFAVLMNRMEMSKLFWERLEEPIGAALTAAQMLQTMQKHTEDTELQSKLRKHGQYYEEIACGVLNECHLSDEARASQELLIRELPNYGNSTCLQLAVEGDNKTFISHACCQSLLNQIWMGKMSHKNKLWRIWLSILFPPLLLGLIYFREDEQSRFANKNKGKQDNPRGLKRQRSAYPIKKKASDAGPGAKNLGDEGLDIRNTGRKLTWYDRIRFFYNAPLTTFLHNCISYLCFLMLFSYILLTNFYPTVSTAEYILMVWVFTLLVEEVRQLLADDASVFRLKLMSYIYDAWNVVDVVTLLFFLTGTVLRLIPGCEGCFEAARIVLALNLMTFWFRILHIFSVQKTLGPMLVMIGRMVIDLLGFFVILMVFVLAYGLASQAILYPNVDLTPVIIVDVLRKAYWQMYGELFLEDIEGITDCTTDLAGNSTLPRCPSEAGTWVTPILLGLYILFTNILMFNLLIAMFSYTFDKVKENTDHYWHYQRYFLIYEYHTRPPLAPPLIILSHIYLSIRTVLRICCKKAHNAGKRNVFKWRIKDEGVSKRLNKWEFMNGEEFIRRRAHLHKATMEMQVMDSKNMLETASVNVEALKDAMLGMRSKQQALANKEPSYLEERFNSIEEQLETTFQALHWIVQNMSGQAKGNPPKLQDPKQRKIEEEEKKNDLAKQEKERYMMMLSEQVRLHVKSRTSPYPEAGPDVKRFQVPDANVPWTVPFPEYSPTEYTSPVVLEGPDWADPDILNSKPEKKLSFNEYDKTYKVNRKSFEGQYKIDKNGLPLNPKGRTGLMGRGLLGRWGPNFSGDPVVTRWKRGENGQIVVEDGRKVLEFVAIQHKDGNREWGIPGGIIQPGQNVLDCLRMEFAEEAMGEDAADSSQRKNEKLEQLIQKGQKVYEGYADDPRNTDNAWLETTAYNYHDEEGKILETLNLKAGASVEHVAWQPVSSKIQLYGGHLNTLRQVALNRNAAF